MCWYEEARAFLWLRVVSYALEAVKTVRLLRDVPSPKDPKDRHFVTKESCGSCVAPVMTVLGPCVDNRNIFVKQF
jgi:hypothetical protein